MDKLLILPFDHRSSFIKDIAKTDDPAIVRGLKGLIFKAFLQTWEKSQDKNSLAVLIDDQYGTDIIRQAKEKGINFTVALEKSGSEIFEFEHGDDFGTSLEEINPTYAKVLIRYIPGNDSVNEKQLLNLEKLAEHCRNTHRRVILELLVPPSSEELEDAERYDQRIRPAKTIQAIAEISSKIIPDIWKMEGFSKENWELIFSQVPFDMKVIVLGRGEDAKKVEEWLSTAAGFENIIGFAVGRTVFSEPLSKLQRAEIDEAEAVQEISTNFERLIELWNSKKASFGL
ncbi:MAG: DUF2090 domain-containing protein [Patescibacteria group bacterium]|jgi:myo-inositol catabolism protein IolC